MGGGGSWFGGERPSPGAASTEFAHAFDFVSVPSHSNTAAPGDGRTPGRLLSAVIDPPRWRASQVVGA